MRRNIPFFLVGSLLFFGFVIFSYLVHKDIFTQIDFNTTVRLQDNIPRRFDYLFSLFSDIGNFEILTIGLVGILLLLRKILGGIMLFIGYTAFHFFEIFGKFFVDHPPPPQFMLRTQDIVELPQFHVRAEFSYPSGHSGRTVYLSAILIYMIWRSERISQYLRYGLIFAILLFDFVMLASRVYLGEHWLTDVVGGSVLSLGLSIFGLGFIVRKKRKKLKSNHKTSKGLFVYES